MNRLIGAWTDLRQPAARRMWKIRSPNLREDLGLLWRLVQAVGACPTRWSTRGHRAFRQGSVNAAEPTIGRGMAVYVTNPTRRALLDILFRARFWVHRAYSLRRTPRGRPWLRVPQRSPA